ncbi:hypothetical protein HPB50_011086 [Hyalomma asiaticum]|uniref:Uncharacterized protein n=1 Tax=Hyalomma asiaticum TaxID=266040 RepID=A0ACB7RTQ0_HYAAI|nr:hypothetical protein HPB50_011086 [Hyalomma asiaticum]
MLPSTAEATLVSVALQERHMSATLCMTSICSFEILLPLLQTEDIPSLEDLPPLLALFLVALCPPMCSDTLEGDGSNGSSANEYDEVMMHDGCGSPGSMSSP